MKVYCTDAARVVTDCKLVVQSQKSDEGQVKCQHKERLTNPRRMSAELAVPSTRRATLGDRAFPLTAAHVWNSLPLETRTCSSLLTFRRETKSHLFRQSYG